MRSLLLLLFFIAPGVARAESSSIDLKPLRAVKQIQLAAKFIGTRAEDEDLGAQLLRNGFLDGSKGNLTEFIKSGRLKNISLAGIKDRRIFRQFAIEINSDEVDSGNFVDRSYALEATFDAVDSPAYTVLRKFVTKQNGLKTTLEVACRAIADSAERLQDIVCPQTVEISLQPLPGVSAEQVRELKVRRDQVSWDKVHLVSWIGRMNANENSSQSRMKRF